jgi:catechol 2,3-dioxygenase-like lactoylglutathione lyase family enzyme
MNTISKVIELSVEVITLPVSDVERALRFYVDRVGFALDVDYSPNEAFRVVQLTPPGPNCSIQIGRGLTDAPGGSLRKVYLVSSRIHLGARLHDIAHDNRLHLIRTELRANNRGANRDSTEMGSRHVLEAAAKGADCSANGFCENN